MAEGKALPMIIAMPNNQVVHRSDPKHTELTFPLFDKELRQHIIPVVEKTYSTQSGPRARAIAGLSMGGRHAQLVGFKSLDLFRSFGILSAGDPESEKSTPEFLNDPAINQKVDYLFVGRRYAREPADESKRGVPPDSGEAQSRSRLLHRGRRRTRLGDVARAPRLYAAKTLAGEVVAEHVVVTIVVTRMAVGVDRGTGRDISNSFHVTTPACSSGCHRLPYVSKVEATICRHHRPIPARGSRTWPDFSTSSDGGGIGSSAESAA